MSASPRQATRVGRNVFIGLVVATVIEYLVAISDVPGALGAILAIASFKAWLIVVYFMHVGRLRRGT